MMKEGVIRGFAVSVAAVWLGVTGCQPTPTPKADVKPVVQDETSKQDAAKPKAETPKAKTAKKAVAVAKPKEVRKAFTVHAWVALAKGSKANGEYGVMFKGSRKQTPHRAEYALSYRHRCPEFKYFSAAGNWHGLHLSGTEILRGNGFEKPLTEIPLLKENAWQQIAGVYDNGRVALYVNGKLVAETKGNPLVPVNDDPVRTGCLETPKGRAGSFLPGSVVMAQHEDRALTTAEIAALYATEKEKLPPLPGPVAYPVVSIDTPIPLVESYNAQLKEHPVALRKANCVAKVTKVDGTPRLVIDGKVISTQAMMPDPRASDAEVRKSCRDFAAAGIRVFSNIWWVRGKDNDWWLGEGKYDWAKVDARFMAMIDGAPEGWVFPRLKMDPPDWWVEKHPGEMYHKHVRPESVAWRDLRRQMVADFVNHVEHSAYAGHVMGYHIGALSGTEWLNYPADNHIKTTYGASIAEALLDAAHQVKTLTKGNKVVGSFHGYNVACHSEFLRVLQSPDIDFICAPATYALRRGGDAGAAQVYCRASCMAHGKLFFEEADIRTHYAKAAVNYRCVTKDESLQAIKRSIGYALTYGQDVWWFLLAGNDTFHDEVYLRAIAQGVHEQARAVRENLPRRAEVVALHTIPEDQRGFYFETLPFSGTSFDTYLTADAKYAAAQKPKVTFACEDEKLTSDQVAARLNEAGVHRYLDTGDLAHAGCGYLMVHATSAGVKTIRLPEACDLIEIFGASPMRTGVKTFEEPMKYGETRVWRMRPSAAPRDAAFRAADAVVVYRDDNLKTKAQRVVMAEAVVALKTALGKIGAREVAVYEEGTEPKDAKALIYLGNTHAARAAGLNVEAMPMMGYRLVCEKGRAFVLARTATATTYGVTALCERYLGYRFLTISGADPYAVNTACVVPVCDELEVPAIYYRHHHRGTSPSELQLHPRFKPRWRTHGRLRRVAMLGEDIEGEERVTPNAPHCHSFFYYLKPEKYFEKHPEYYSLGTDGKRHGQRNKQSQPCMTHPDVRRIMTEGLLAKIAEDRKQWPTDYPKIYDFTQMDISAALCRCPDCMKVIAKYERTAGKPESGGDAGLQLEFVNDIAQRVKAKYPDVILRTFAYVSTEVPPNGGIVPDDNVIIWLCDLYTCCDHELPLETPFNAKRRDLFVDWMKIAKRFEIWDYMLYGDGRDGGGAAGDFPEVNVDAIAADAKFFHRLGISRMFMESEFHDQPFYELNSYVMSEVWWNPYVDLEKLIDNFCTVYGKAAGKMREAIDVERAMIRDNPLTTENANKWYRRELPWHTIANFEKLRDLYDAAYAMDEDPEVCARIAWLQASVNRKLASLYGNANRPKDRAAAYKRAYAAAVTSRKVDFVPENAKEWKRAELTLSSKYSEVRFKDMPPEVAKLPDDEIYCVDVTYLIRKPPSLYWEDAKSERGKGMKVMKRVGNTLELPDIPIATSAGSFTPEKGGGYRWYKLGKFSINRFSNFWVTPAGCAYFQLGTFYRHADGVGVEDPNNYDVWLSARFDDALYIDRLLLRRRHDAPAKKAAAKKTKASKKGNAK